MSDGVNLLTIEKKKEKKFGNFFTGSLLILVIMILISIGLLMYMIFLKTSFAGVTQAEGKALSTLNSYSSKRIKLQTLSERLTSIEKIIPENTKFSERISFIVKSFPPQFEVDGINVDGASLTVTLIASNLEALNSYINKDLHALVRKKNSDIKNVSIQNFGINPARGSYSTSIYFIYNTAL